MNEIWSVYIVPCLYVVGTAVLGFMIKNALPAYFSEKGKNIATKEDIAEITRLVETVKQSFVRENEQLKARLSLLHTVQTGLVAEERTAIIDYNEKYFQWLHALLDSGFGNLNDKEDEDLDKYQQLLSDRYARFLSSEARFNLFIENQPLVDYAGKMKMETLKLLADLPSTCILNLKHNNAELAYIKKNIPLPDRGAQHRALLQKRVQFHEVFTNDLIKGYETIAPMNKTFQKMCRDYIYQLLQQQERKE